MPDYYQPVLEAARVDNQVLKIGPKQAEVLNLPDQTSTYLYTGKNRVQITISISDSDKNTNCFYLSAAVLKRLGLQNKRAYGVSVQPDGIHIGPVIGIMAQSNKQIDKPFGAQSFFIKQLITTAREMGAIAFGYSPSDVNWNDKTIAGYTCSARGWVRKTFPLPDVVYPRESGYSPFNRQVRKRMENAGCKFLNPALVGKWQTFQLLSKHDLLKDYLPDTSLAGDFGPVEKMLNRYHTVYMKPITGSKGRNIIKIYRKSGSAFYYHYQLHNQLHSGRAASIAGLKSALRKVMGNHTYIVQKEINLLRSERSILDVRVMTQKDCTGEFSITGKACRIGRPGSITSNLSTGGHGQKIDVILARNFKDPEQRNRILNEVDQIALEAARTLDQALGGVGELGIDIGIDREGKVWFIEANLRPARKIFLLIGDTDIRKQSIQRPLLYSRYLAGFTNK